MVALRDCCPASLKRRKNPAIPSGPAAHKSCLFPSTLSLVQPSSLQGGLKSCPAGLAKLVPARTLGRTSGGGSGCSSNLNLEKQELKRRWGLWMTRLVPQLPGREGQMNPQTSMSEVIVQGLLKVQAVAISNIGENSGSAIAQMHLTGGQSKTWKVAELRGNKNKCRGIRQTALEEVKVHYKNLGLRRLSKFEDEYKVKFFTF